MTFNGTQMNLGNIMKLSNAVTRSITAENVYGEKGKGGMADLSVASQEEVKKIGQKWDGPNPCARDPAKTVHFDDHGCIWSGDHPAYLVYRGPQTLSRPDRADVLG